MEGSVDGKNWTTIYEKDKGGGGTDTILIKEGTYRYLRLSDFEKEGRRNPELAEIEVYGDETYFLADGQPGLELAGRFENAILYRLQKSGIIVIALAVAVIATIVTIVIFYRRKKKKQLKENN
jgi:hypothetical protein